MPKQKQKRAFSSKLYFSVMNEHFINTVMLQTALIVSYLIIWLKLDANMRLTVRSKYNEVVDNSEDGVLKLQQLNTVDWLGDEVVRYEQACTTIGEYAKFSTRTKVATLRHLTQADASQRVGYFVDGLDVQAFEQLPAELQAHLRDLASPFVAGPEEDYLSRQMPGLVAFSLTKLEPLTNRTATVVKLVDKSIRDLTGVFSHADTCFETTLCKKNMLSEDGKFRFSLFSGTKGIHFSPLRWYPDSSSNQVHTYTVETASTIITVFFRLDLQSLRRVLSETGSRFAVFSESSPEDRTEDLAEIAFGRKLIDTLLFHELDPSHPDYRSLLDTYLSSYDGEKGVAFHSSVERKTLSKSLTSLFAFRVHTSFQIESTAFRFSQTQFIATVFTQISIQITALVLVFVLYIYFTHR